MARLPQVSGKGLTKLLKSLGYRVLKRKEPNVVSCLMITSRDHIITFRDDPLIAKSRVNDILNSISASVRVPYDSLVAKLKEIIRSDQGTRISRTQLTEAEEAYAKKLERMGLRLSDFVRYADGSLSFGGAKTVPKISNSHGHPVQRPFSK